jgi:alkanesulfonate monooxygenase SsuD/methylene tetrahydromethanopterin reductase-like flavin-dependent oxidoreductase (luciferase family)
VTTRKPSAFDQFLRELQDTLAKGLIVYAGKAYRLPEPGDPVKPVAPPRIEQP